MKGKGAPNLYEILKSSDSDPSKPEPAAETVRVADPPPPEPAPAVAEAEPVPVAKAEPVRPLVRPSAPTMPKPTVAEPGDMGERTLTLTYNTTGFLILVLLGMLFVAYSIGVKKGRADVSGSVTMKEFGAAETTPAVAEESKPASVVPTPPRPEPVWSIHLMEWEANRNADRLAARVNAQKLKDALAGKGLKEAWFEEAVKEGRKRVVLYFGRYTKQQEPQAREALQALREFKMKSGGAATTPFEGATAVPVTN